MHARVGPGGTCELRWFGGWTAIADQRIDSGGNVFRAMDEEKEDQCAWAFAGNSEER